MASQDKDCSLDAFFSKEFRLWAPYSRTATNVIDTSTFQRAQESDESVIHHESIPSGRLLRWLSQSSSEDLKTTENVFTCRIVWINRDTRQKLDHVSETALSQIIEAFCLNGILEHCVTMIAGVQAFPPFVDGERETRILRYSYGMHPKQITLWSVNAAKKQTSAIVFASKEQIDLLKKLSHLPRERYDMLLPVMNAAILVSEIDGAQEGVKNEVRAIEARTGFHKWATRTENPAIGDLSSLSASLSGFSTRLAAIERKNKVIRLLLDFVIEGVHSPEVLFSTISFHRDLEDVANLRKRNFAQTIDTCFIQQRLDVQQKSVSHLIAEYDALSNYRIAQETKVIAMASQRDSSSMKILAAVTVFYLPSQAIASIFGMSLFNWTAGQGVRVGSSVVNDRFYIYWAVTIPLTFVTLGAAIGWLYFEKRYRQSTTMVNPEKLDLGSQENTHSEIANLTARRSRTMTM